jgi:hypothetical protein
MLVLALQFSRCDVTHAELADPDVAPGRPARRSGVGRFAVASSLKTEEKTVATVVHARERDRIPATSSVLHDSPTSAPTGIVSHRTDDVRERWRDAP